MKDDDIRLSWWERNQRIEALSLPNTLPDMLAEAAGRWPNQIAYNFFDRGETRTFAQLRVEVRRLADALQQLGIRHGDHVAVMLSNRIEYPITWLALAEIGAVMAPIVLSSTPREIHFFISDCEARFLVVEEPELRTRSMRPGEGPLPPAENVIFVGPVEEHRSSPRYDTLVAQGSADFAPLRAPTANDPVNIQYTSGTTGLPKGAMLSHRYWIIGAAATMEFFGIDHVSALSVSPFYYIDAQAFALKALYSGARVDFSPRPSINRFVDWLYQNQTSVTWLTEQVLELPPRPEERAAGVKLFLGYSQSVETIKRTLERFGAPTRELYGATEFGGGAAVPLVVEDPAILGTCGVPLPFRRLRIVREDGREAVPGEVGELWVSGDGLLQGYWKRPEANADFLADGWFRTGDLFVQDDRGYYSIVGRIKDMIRRSEENISALEVEQVIKDFPGVLDSAVVAVPDPEREEEVKAYILMAPNLEPPSFEEILSHCRERLAPFKVPRYLTFVDEFPYTPSEKVAKKQLTAGVDDLRAGAWDARDQIQR
ncbi:class I adenylate-forming enzyme family protein [Phenylobacterium montanum]|uniref:Acyl--CoA ligase n=1 Tax=Phenylobacterium montanum TaxID=2823693 RepID=A0A975G3I0_9CAUL|nr:class I adenylate-forming enzyme family protein [Caulobacter sp. S6]QUD89832.1 acyl--CoA ligase [Caulobacter sp. S6]